MPFHCLNTNIYPYLETSGGQSSNLYLNVVHFSTLVLIRHLWQLKTAVFLHWHLIRTVLLLNGFTWIGFQVNPFLFAVQLDIRRIKVTVEYDVDAAARFDQYLF